MPARLTPKWRVIVRILKWGAIGTSFTEFNTEGEHRSACHRSVWPVPGRCAAHGVTGRRVGDDDSSRPAQDSCLLDSLDRTPATDFEEASGAAQAAPFGSLCVVSERVRARNALW